MIRINTKIVNRNIAYENNTNVWKVEAIRHNVQGRYPL